jgi:hypothetical protein
MDGGQAAQWQLVFGEFGHAVFSMMHFLSLRLDYGASLRNMHLGGRV